MDSEQIGHPFPKKPPLVNRKRRFKSGRRTNPQFRLADCFADKATYLSSNVVKVVCDDRGRALYFSRSPIPMVRDGEPDFAAKPARFLQHLGVYAYRRNFLLKIAGLPPHPLEESEKLEQLRVLGTGGTIAVGRVARAHRGVDTPADYAAFVRWYREGGDGGTRRAA